MARAPKQSATNRVRIIGGQHRGRLIEFPDGPHLRPTPDRVRETVFNWLQFHVAQTRCLDLFAGSGVMGLEALSRGAQHCVFIDRNPQAVQALRDNVQKLQLDAYSHIENNSAENFLQKNQQDFDIVFFDPPYGYDNIVELLLLIATSCLANNALLYFETDKSFNVADIPRHFRVLKEKKAGQVYYRLLEFIGS